jgi:hypothetical protein
LHHTVPKRALSNIKCDVAGIICNVDDLIYDVDNILCNVDKYFVTKFFDVYEGLYLSMVRTYFIQIREGKIFV